MNNKVPLSWATSVQLHLKEIGSGALKEFDLVYFHIQSEIMNDIRILGIVSDSIASLGYAGEPSGGN